MGVPCIYSKVFACVCFCVLASVAEGDRSWEGPPSLGMPRARL